MQSTVLVIKIYPLGRTAKPTLLESVPWDDLYTDNAAFAIRDSEAGRECPGLEPFAKKFVGVFGGIEFAHCPHNSADCTQLILCQTLLEFVRVEGSTLLRVNHLIGEGGIV